MDILKNFLKKYAALLPPIGLLIFAGILLLPTLWIGSKVSAQMEQSARQAQSINSLMGNVPPRGKAAQIRQYMDQLETEVKQIETLVEQSSKRELVAYNIFPKPTDTSSQIFTEFGRKYRTAIEDLITAMNALDAPSEAEIRAQTGTRTAGTTTGTFRAGDRRTPSTDPMVDALCLARAESISVYANPSLFSWYEFWKEFRFEGSESAIEDCWHSQVALWIYQDIAETLNTMNIGSNRVSTSPAKRLLGVSFSGPVVLADQSGTAGGGRRQQTAAGRDNPNYVSPELASAFVNKPWTEREGGDEYDVVHFALSVIVDSRHVLGFMRELSGEKEHTFFEDFNPNGRRVSARRNQITVLQNAVHSVDKDSPSHELYRYGPGAVVRLDLVCEYLFMRKGYDTLKPESIKEMLGQSDAQGAPDGAGGAGGMGYGW